MKCIEKKEKQPKKKQEENNEFDPNVLYDDLYTFGVEYDKLLHELKDEGEQQEPEQPEQLFKVITPAS